MVNPFPAVHMVEPSSVITAARTPNFGGKTPKVHPAMPARVGYGCETGAGGGSSNLDPRAIEADTKPAKFPVIIPSFNSVSPTLLPTSQPSLSYLQDATKY